MRKNEQRDFAATMPPKRKRRNVMHRFHLEEISIVDRPACEPCRAAIAKRQEDNPMNERSFDTFEAAVAFLKSQGASGTEAYRQVASERPDLLDTYQKGAGELIAKARDKAEATGPNEHAVIFDELVDQVAIERRIGKTDAMKIVRRQHPDLFTKMQEAGR